jgi:hypothetical protein
VAVRARVERVTCGHALSPGASVERVHYVNATEL